MTNEKEYLSDILFHFWNHQPEERAFEVFVSIVDKGFLLTRGTVELLDRFYYLRKDGNLDFIECVQNGRICFTDIPEDKISSHCERYGKCGIGFSRQTIINWGGCPVWYLPNHFVKETLQDHSGGLAYGLADAVTLLGLFSSFLEKNGLSLTNNNLPLTPAASSDKIEFARQSLLRLMSFLKSMSTRDNDDHFYLFEREWRIVSGLRSDHYGDPTRKLTPEEKAIFISAKPEWNEQIQSTDPRITAKFSKEPMIESFSFFNGIPEKEPVSKKIEKIRCSTENFHERISEYISFHPDKFKDGGPDVVVAD